MILFLGLRPEAFTYIYIYIEVLTLAGLVRRPGSRLRRAVL